MIEFSGTEEDQMSNTLTQFGQSLQNLMNESLGVVASGDLSLVLSTDLADARSVLAPRK
jgi:hypothetical protein